MAIIQIIMVKLKTILDTRRAKSDGTFPIMFRITNQKQVNYLSFGIAINKNEWDEKSSLLKSRHPNAISINTSLNKRFYELQKAILILDEAKTFSIDNLKEILNTSKELATKPTTFLEFANTVIAELIEVKRTGNAQVYLTAVNRLVSYSNNPKVKFVEINYTFLEGFKNKLIQDGVKKNTVGNYFRSIRALYNKAIKAKLVDRTLYPFFEITIKTERTAKRAIAIDWRF
jgi:integrase/recombinase XerD